MYLSFIRVGVNLDVIISVDNRVKFLRGTQFRIWAMGKDIDRFYALNKLVILSNFNDYKALIYSKLIPHLPPPQPLIIKKNLLIKFFLFIQAKS